jgi:hypothetical protein
MQINCEMANGEALIKKRKKKKKKKKEKAKSKQD